MNDPLAEASTPSISFKEAQVGYSITGTVVGDPEMVQSRDFKTKEPAYWPDGNKKMSLVVKLDLGHEEGIRSLWVPKPSAMWGALADARARAGVPLNDGCVLTVTFTGTKPTAGDPQKLYSASYTAPTRPAADPLGASPSPQGAQETPPF